MNNTNFTFDVNPKIENLKKFFNENPNNQETFRYFKKRDFNVIENHTLTVLLYSENNIIGYGHLDKDGEKTWLGIMLCDNCIGNGIGNIIMDKLIEQKKDNIFLSVDKNNIVAKKLYIKKGFVLSEEKENYIIMKLNKN